VKRSIASDAKPHDMRSMRRKIGLFGDSYVNCIDYAIVKHAD
jgi:hypothetical protein